MEIHNGVKYDSNYARAAAYFLGTTGGRPEQPARQAAFDLIVRLYNLIAENPEKLGLTPAEDVYFRPWEQQRDRQNDVKTIRTTMDRVEQIIGELFDITVLGEVNEQGFGLPQGCKPRRTLGKALAELGVMFEKGQLHLPPDCAAGLKELSEISKAHVIPIKDGSKENEHKDYFYFSHCVFEPESDWLIEALDNRLSADGQLIWLCRELEARGYERIDCKDGKRISLDFVKQFGKKQEPVKVSWADKTHSGIEVTFEDLRLEPYFVWLRVPNFKTVLDKVNELPEDVRAFFGRNIKTCDGCRYCVQTDKTGSRPLAAVDVDGTMKCPYFPSFSMNWRALDAELAVQMLAVTDAVEKILRD